jgi:hypothetical protein
MKISCLRVPYLRLPAVAHAEKEKAVQNKAYTDAVRSHQRQEEILGFRKIPVQSQGMHLQTLLSFSSYDYEDCAGPESEDEDEGPPTASSSSIVFIFVFYNLTEL